jgi:hypothetical protein
MLNSTRAAALAWSFLLALAAGEGSDRDPAAEFTARSEKLGDRNPKGWLELATFCEKHRLLSQRDEALRKVLVFSPDNAEAHERLDEVKVGKTWVAADQAEEAEKGQAKGRVFYGAKWVPPSEAAKLREADRKLVGWPCETRVDTPRVTVYSARPLDFTRRLAALLENEVGAYERLHDKVWKLDAQKKLTAQKLKVYLFPDRASCLEKLNADSGGKAPKAPLGVYYDGTRTMYIGQHSQIEFDPAQVFCTCAHEMVHAMDHLLARQDLGISPFWVWEGRAEYFGYSVHGRKLLPGGFWLHAGGADMPNVLGKALEAISLREMMDLREYGEFGLDDYALAWAFVHFLYHGEGGKHAAGFQAYLAGIPRKAKLSDFEAAVGKLSVLEPAFRNYVETVFLPAVRAGIPADWQDRVKAP